MPDAKRRSPTSLFIVDNSDDDWKVVNYLQQWTEIARSFDIATGYFEIGGLLALDGFWQKLDKIRILMGDEVSRRTKRAFEAGLAGLLDRLDRSIEAEKERNDFLSGVPAIVDAIRKGTILARVYRKRKFHAKTFITHGRMDVIGSTALVGSSNFTYPGLTQNVELNVQLQREVDRLQEWYEAHWDEAEDITPDILKTIERHTRERTPFEIYVRAMEAFFKGHAPSVGEWERTGSTMYPMLSEYQRDGYRALMSIARRYGGAFLCDGVGLGKTYVGLMIIERLLFERKRVALFVPKSTLEDVWRVRIQEYMPKALGQFSNLVIYSHTDLLRGGAYPAHMEEVKEEVDAIVIDEAHHFRNLSSQRYEKLYKICEGKLIYMLTATPVNNSFFDLLHMMELFTRRDPGYFGRGSLGIHSLRGHFRRMESALETLVGDDKQVDLDQQAAEAVLARDDLFRELVIQRSRAYVKESLRQHGDGQVTFPQRKDPQVVPYSLLRTYRGLLDRLEDAFFQPKGRGPLLSLPIYFPLAYYRGDDAAIDPMEQGRQRQVVGLIRTLLLKRFESSAVAFEASCKGLLLKLLYFIRLHNEKTARRWIDLHASLIDRIKAQDPRRDGSGEQDEDAEEDIIPEEAKKRIVRLNPEEYSVDEMIMESLDDLDTLVGFLDELHDFDPARDHKLQQLIQLMQTDATLRQHKVLIFTEYRDTAHYLREQLEAAGVGPLDEVDSLTRRSRSDIIRAFSPYYNGSSSAALAEAGHPETRVLVSTDVLSEGLNLQDATCIINYDLHWNPVRLMQRIGRVDRRLNPALETQMIHDHPEVAAVRGTVSLWNFLPPDELNRILSLYQRVTNKTLRISKIFGIEGKKLLTPDDDYEALKTFSRRFEGTPSQLEKMRLAYQALQRDYPELVAAAALMPLRLFTGKQLDAHPSGDRRARGVFFCYQLPARDVSTGEWSNEAGIARWYLYWFDTDEIVEDVARAFECIRCEPDTPRNTVAADIDLVSVRKKLDKHVTNSYLKKVQAPIGVKAKLLAWMELV